MQEGLYAEGLELMERKLHMFWPETLFMHLTIYEALSGIATGDVPSIRPVTKAKEMYLNERRETGKGRIVGDGYVIRYY